MADEPRRIKSGATGLDDEPVRRPRLPRRDELSGLPLVIEAPLAIGLDDQRKRGMSPTRRESHYRIEFLCRFAGPRGRSGDSPADLLSTAAYRAKR
jgi:hypothetical protein